MIYEKPGTAEFLILKDKAFRLVIRVLIEVLHHLYRLNSCHFCIEVFNQLRREQVKVLFGMSQLLFPLRLRKPIMYGVPVHAMLIYLPR